MKRYKSYPKRDPIQNYFPLPNEIYILGLTAGEIAVYGYLLYCENRKTYQCYPSYKTIGRAISMSKNTVSKYVRILEDKGFIWTEQTSIITKDGIKRNGNLLYTIRPIQEVLDRFYATQFAQMELEQKRADVRALVQACADSATEVLRDTQTTVEGRNTTGTMGF